MAVQIAIVQESELQARLRIIQNAFKERNNCILLRLDTHVNGEKGLNPFGFHFEFDRNKYEENKERKKRLAVTRWLAIAAYLHHKFGIRHILLIVMMSLYAILGGLIFEALEAGNEKQLVAETVQDMTIVINNFVDLIVNITFTETDETHFYTNMLITEDRFLGSAWHKAEDLELNIQWTTLPAMFYAFTLFTTIGYGSIACYTWVGRYVSILYACIGIPLMLLTIGDLGEVLQRRLVVLVAWIEARWCCFRHSKDADDVEKNAIQEEEETEQLLPMWLAASLLLIYLSFVSVGIYLGDKMGPQETDFPLSASFYFVFISITTTGFGDVMPNSAQYNPLTSLAFLFGLVLVSIVNSTVYSQMYDYFYKGIMSMEGTLDALHAEAYEISGHKLFKKFSSAFTTLSLSFPSTAFSTPSQSFSSHKEHSETEINFEVPRNFVLPQITFTEPSLKKSHVGRSIQSGNERCHSENLAKIPEEIEPRSHRALSEEIRPRALSFRSIPGTFGAFEYQNRLPSPTLGPLGGVDIATAARRKGIARMKRNSSSLSDRQC